MIIDKDCICWTRVRLSLTTFQLRSITIYVFTRFLQNENVGFSTFPLL